jgi:hypothetical protein
MEPLVRLVVLVELILVEVAVEIKIVVGEALAVQE